MGEGTSKLSLGKILVFLIVLGLVAFAVKVVMGWFFVVLKWILIGVVALFITWLIFRKSKAGD